MIVMVIVTTMLYDTYNVDNDEDCCDDDDCEYDDSVDGKMMVMIN